MVELSVVFGLSALAVGGGWIYFRSFQPARPPVGVFNSRDVWVILIAVVVMPLIYLRLPLAVVAALFALAFSTTSYMTLEPVLRWRWLTGSAVLILIGGDVALALLSNGSRQAFLAVNDLILVVSVIGVASLWAQSGMKARHVAAMAFGLTVYDVVATWQLSLMADLLGRLARIPLAPMVGWGGARTGLAIGLGDLLVMTVFPLVMRKAFGRRAGLVAMGSVLLAAGALLALAATGTPRVIPAMVALGPLILIQYAFWMRRRRLERTTVQYLSAEPTRPVSTQI